jgi:tetratricopeptide (TPR) repeat protein
LGEENAETLTSASLLADLLRRQGEFEKAELILTKVLELTREKARGSLQHDFASALNDLGDLKFEQGKYRDAESLFREALQIRQRLLGEAHLQTLETLNDLALTLQRLDEIRQAVPMLRQVFDGHRRALGNNHPDVAQSANNLAMAHYRLKEYAEAEPLFREALAINRQAFGNEHPEVATTLSNLASLRRERGTIGRPRRCCARVSTSMRSCWEANTHESQQALYFCPECERTLATTLERLLCCSRRLKSGETPLEKIAGR